ncbi:hypothetical protein BCR26_09035 [Enterococcus rivorum]|uniref:Uncharacterized protein n=1 Tax=Enterococcus rivorum TaxID=762845 RepID=A0A1E5L0B8_9ENTE|nr:hypothetical protein BCR26_09035 [Enterococcus rivorum]
MDFLLKLLGVKYLIGSGEDFQCSRVFFLLMLCWLIISFWKMLILLAVCSIVVFASIIFILIKLRKFKQNFR